jgi:hypothetical protein
MPLMARTIRDVRVHPHALASPGHSGMQVNDLHYWRTIATARHLCACKNV